MKYKQTNRRINGLVIHCAATPPNMDIGAKEIRDWHVHKEGWSDIGYHLVIRRNGVIEAGRPLQRAGAHVAGYNARTIGICLMGGVDANRNPEANYTREQWAALKAVMTDLKAAYPDAAIKGHHDYPYVNKACPCFDVAEWLKKEGLA